MKFQMKKLCKCGCGQFVKTIGANYVLGHCNKDPEVKRKKKETCLKNYGVEFSFQSDQCKQKSKNTCLKKYGTEYSSQNITNREKYKKTCMDKYGVSNPSKLKEIKEKKKNTCLKNYGVESPYQSKVIKTKIKKTCQNRYGGIGFSSKLLNGRVTDMILKRYQVNNYSKTILFRQLAKQIIIDRLNNQMKNGEEVSPRIGKLEPKFFEWLQEFTEYHISRPKQNLFGCFPDGFIKELSIVIEFDEPYHIQPVYQKRDAIKNKIYNLHNLKIFRVSQKEWEENPDSIKEKFITLTESIQINS